MSLSISSCSTLGLLIATIGFMLGGAGAAEPSTEPKIQELEIQEPEVTASDREHWAWMPLERPPLPQVENKAWPQSAIDYFVLAELERDGLSPTLPAPKLVMLRRLKYDLHGLPPSRTEIERFLRDTQPDAYRRLVDRLLADPAYGERWAQPWLDLARFAETDGFEHDKVREGVWKYRDWVVDALNGDMSYRDFIGYQLAGDKSPEQEHAVATVFCMAGPDMPDINEQDLRRHDRLNEMTSTVGSALLAMQMHCAQCHDHKYDPISQADFYRLRAIFEPAVPTMRRDVQVHFLAAQAEPQPARLYYRGELLQAGPQVRPAVPRVASAEGEDVYCDEAAPREEFVEWLFQPENPLTARVIVNRVWQHHFGVSLTENPDDFGVIAAGPTHPELLDWLAVELQQQQWSLKQLHRTILLSATYRLASTSLPGDAQWSERIETDPSNFLLGRFPRRRLDGEAIRDSLLAISGQLDRRMGGAGVMPPLPTELLGTLLKGQWEASPDEADHVRRSIYIFARRNLRFPIFEAFDRPDAGTSCGRRNRSTTAIQSLHMLNSELTYTAAERLAQRVQAETPDTSELGVLVEQVFWLTLSRPPGQSELAFALELLAADEASEPVSKLPLLCLALFNTNEFLYID